MELSKFFAQWHPVLVHFPIAFLYFAACLDVFGYLTKNTKAAWAGLVLTAAGTVGLMMAFITGNYAEIVAAHQQIQQKPIGDHEAWATATSWTFILLTGWRSYLKPGTAGYRKNMPMFLLAAVLTLGCLTVTGYKGGRLVYDHAAGVNIATSALPHPATPQDLANLSLKNSEDELAYSGMMHHVFGWLTLGLALWQAYQHFNLPGQEKARALGPIMLTGGGIFLMICSDWDAWPLGDTLPITDPEVLFHKILATIMIFFGIGMNLARRRPKGEVNSLQSHLLAILALVGGGMLFTHVHTGAPFSSTAMGVYVQHFVIGCLALACGGVKMLETVMPERKTLWDRCWIVLLIVIAANLIWYVEGFPWYIHNEA